MAETEVFAFEHLCIDCLEETEGKCLGCNSPLCDDCEIDGLCRDCYRRDQKAKTDIAEAKPDE